MRNIQRMALSSACSVLGESYHIVSSHDRSFGHRFCADYRVACPLFAFLLVYGVPLSSND